MQETPSTGEVMEVAETKNVKVEGVAVGMSTHAKLTNVLATIVAAVIALAVGMVLADGTSVIKLKAPEFLPRATDPAMKAEGFDYRLDELLGPTYGVGLHHDQAGFTWTDVHAGDTLKDIIANLGLPAVAAAVPYVISTDDLKHPVPFLKCGSLKTAGLAAVSFGFIAEAVAVLMVIFHAIVLAGLLPSNVAKPLAALIWATLSAGFLVVILLAISVYYGTWTCDNPIIPEIVLSDHFEYSYGFAFAIIGFLSAVLVFCATVCGWPMDDAAPAPTLVIPKILCGVTLGVVLAFVQVFLLLSANGAFEGGAGSDHNPCEAQKPYHVGPGDNYFRNTECVRDGIIQTLEQAGANVTRGYVGGMDVGDRVPITGTYADNGLCPVNVHWHLGAEHLSVGQFDEGGHGPAAHAHYDPTDGSTARQLAADARLGFRCHHYDSHDDKFTRPYNWQHCTQMEVGETYEIHWPHSAAGACGTDWQYQTPFYDGVFCRDGIINLAPLNTYKKIGVQSQVFTVVNDEAYYYPDLIQGMIVDPAMGKGIDIAKYTGSTTGTSRNNNVCSRYTPITWQVDRTCHLISASSFDKLCQDMGGMRDDMSGDYYPHGSRELVAHHLAADNQQSRSRE